MKTQTISINFEMLVDYLQGKLSREEENKINFLLLSDEKNYWEFIQLRALKKANLLGNYLENDLLESVEKNQIPQKQLINYIKNEITLEEEKNIKAILSKDEKTNFEFIKLKALFEEDELDNYLDSKNEFIDSILEKVQMQTNEYKINQDEIEEITLSENKQNTKSISLKTYLSFAASFVLLMVFSFLIYDYVQEKEENQRLTLENKKNNSSTNEYQTLGTNENNKTENKIEDKLLLHTEDALDILMSNISFIAKMKKETKKENSKQHLIMMKEYLNTEAKISVVFIKNEDENIEFSDSEKFFKWLIEQEKGKSISLKNYTVVIKLEEKNEVIIKNGKIENSVPTNFLKEGNFKIEFTNLTLEIE